MPLQNFDPALFEELPDYKQSALGAHANALGQGVESALVGALGFPEQLGKKVGLINDRNSLVAARMAEIADNEGPRYPIRQDLAKTFGIGLTRGVGTGLVDAPLAAVGGFLPLMTKVVASSYGATSAAQEAYDDAPAEQKAQMVRPDSLTEAGKVALETGLMLGGGAAAGKILGPQIGTGLSSFLPPRVAAPLAAGAADMVGNIAGSTAGHLATHKGKPLTSEEWGNIVGMGLGFAGVAASHAPPAANLPGLRTAKEYRDASQRFGDQTPEVPVIAPPSDVVAPPASLIDPLSPASSKALREAYAAQDSPLQRGPGDPTAPPSTPHPTAAEEFAQQQLNRPLTDAERATFYGTETPPERPAFGPQTGDRAADMLAAQDASETAKIAAAKAAVAPVTGLGVDAALAAQNARDLAGLPPLTPEERAGIIESQRQAQLTAREQAIARGEVPPEAPPQLDQITPVERARIAEAQRKAANADALAADLARRQAKDGRAELDQPTPEPPVVNLPPVVEPVVPAPIIDPVTGAKAPDLVVPQPVPIPTPIEAPKIELPPVVPVEAQKAPEVPVAPVAELAPAPPSPTAPDAAASPVFTRDEIQVSKPQNATRKRANGTDGESTTRIEAPSRVTDRDAWSQIEDHSKLSATVVGKRDFKSGKLPSKGDAAWSAFSKDGKPLARDLTYEAAVEVAKDHVESANGRKAPPEPQKPPATPESLLAALKAGGVDVAPEPIAGVPPEVQARPDFDPAYQRWKKAESDLVMEEEGTPDHLEAKLEYKKAQKELKGMGVDLRRLEAAGPARPGELKPLTRWESWKLALRANKVIYQNAQRLGNRIGVQSEFAEGAGQAGVAYDPKTNTIKVNPTVLNASVKELGTQWLKRTWAEELMHAEWVDAMKKESSRSGIPLGELIAKFGEAMEPTRPIVEGFRGGKVSTEQLGAEVWRMSRQLLESGLITEQNAGVFKTVWSSMMANLARKTGGRLGREVSGTEKERGVLANLWDIADQSMLAIATGELQLFAKREGETASSRVTPKDSAIDSTESEAGAGRSPDEGVTLAGDKFEPPTQRTPVPPPVAADPQARQTSLPEGLKPSDITPLRPTEAPIDPAKPPAVPPPLPVEAVRPRVEAPVEATRPPSEVPPAPETPKAEEVRAEAKKAAQEMSDAGVDASSLRPAERDVAARELGFKQWTDAAAVKFKEAFAEWMVTGKAATEKLVEIFKKLAATAKKVVLSAAVALSFSPSDAAKIPMSEIRSGIPHAARAEYFPGHLADSESAGAYMESNAGHAGSATKVSRAGRSDFGSSKPSAEAKETADWILRSRDNEGAPFAVADKTSGKIYFFDKSGTLIEEASALYGKAVGDTLTPETMAKDVDDLAPSEKVTPAGRFNLKVKPARELGQAAFFEGSNLAIHKVYLGTPSENRRARLVSNDPTVKRISYGCINVDPKVMGSVVEPMFKKGGAVYVLPELASGKAAFEAMKLERGGLQGLSDLQLEAAKPAARAETPNLRLEAASPRSKLDEYGLTKDLREAGFVLPDGGLINLSGGKPGKRTVPHEEAAGGSREIQRLTEEGVMRVDSELGGIQLAKTPTGAQEGIIRRLAETHEGVVSVDLTDGSRRSSLVFAHHTAPVKVVGSIRRFFRGEDIPNNLQFFAAGPFGNERLIEIAKEKLPQRIETIKKMPADERASLVERLGLRPGETPDTIAHYALRHVQNGLNIGLPSDPYPEAKLRALEAMRDQPVADVIAPDINEGVAERAEIRRIGALPEADRIASFKAMGPDGLREFMGHMGLKPVKNNAANIKEATKYSRRHYEVTRGISLEAAGPRQKSEDSDYMRAVKTGDNVTLRRLVAQRAKASGFDKMLWHGSNETVPRDGYTAGARDASTQLRELSALASKHGIKQSGDAAVILERWVEMDMPQANAADAKRARELTNEIKSRSGDYVPASERLAFDVFNQPSGEQELGVHLGTKSQAEQMGTAFPFFIKAKKTFRTPDLGTWNYQAVMREARKAGVKISEVEYERVFNAADNNKALRELLISKGYDGVVYKNEAEGTGDSLIVFKPEQIKSAEPITKNSSGEVIPLSKRFNEDSPIYLEAAGPGGNIERVIETIKQHRSIREQRDFAIKTKAATETRARDIINKAAKELEQFVRDPEIRETLTPITQAIYETTNAAGATVLKIDDVFLSKQRDRMKDMAEGRIAHAMESSIEAAKKMLPLYERAVKVVDQISNPRTPSDHATARDVSKGLQSIRDNAHANQMLDLTLKRGNGASIANYIRQLHQPIGEDHGKALFGQSFGSGSNSSHLRPRTYQTYADAIMNGLIPLTMDPAQLVAHRTMASVKEAEARNFITALGNTNMPVESDTTLADRQRMHELLKTKIAQDGDKAIAAATTPAIAAGIRTRVARELAALPVPVKESLPMVAQGTAKLENGRTIIDPPHSDYVPLKYTTDKSLHAHPAIAGLINSLMAPSHLRETSGGRALLNTWATVKHGLLQFDSFHGARMLTYLATVVLATTRNPMEALRTVMEAGKFSRPGKLGGALDYTDAAMTDMVAKGQMTSQEMAASIALRPAVRFGADQGLEIGRIMDNLYGDIYQGSIKKWIEKNAPPVYSIGKSYGKVIEGFNKWIFEKVTRRSMFAGFDAALTHAIDGASERMVPTTTTATNASGGRMATTVKAPGPKLTRADFDTLAAQRYNTSNPFTPAEAARWKIYQELGRDVAKQINLRMGNVGKQLLGFRHSNIQDAARIGFLAPQWAITQMVSEVKGVGQMAKYGAEVVGKAVTGDFKGAKDVRMGLSGAILAYGMAGTLAATLVGNAITRALLPVIFPGTKPNDDQDPAWKQWSHFYIPVGPNGMYVSALPPTMELSHSLSKYVEGSRKHLPGAVAEAAGKIAWNKAHPIIRLAEEARKGEDYAGRHIGHLAAAGNFVKGVLPIPIGARGLSGALGFGEPTRLTGRETLTQSLLSTLGGMKSEPGKTAERRIQQKAIPLMPDRVREASGRSSEYWRLKAYATSGSEKDLVGEIRRLKAEGKTEKQIMQSVAINTNWTQDPRTRPILMKEISGTGLMEQAVKEQVARQQRVGAALAKARSTK